MCFAKSLMSNNKLFKVILFSWDTGKAVTEWEKLHCGIDNNGSS